MNMKCRNCNSSLNQKILDLGFAPPSNAYLTSADLMKPERTYPLRLMVCEYCFLVQTEDYSQREELFASDYAYFSSVSSYWVAHAKSYCDMIISRLGLNKDKLVVEVASNDGYLLKNFVATGIPCIGIEPTDSTAEAAEALGVPVIREFFGKTFALDLFNRQKKADLIICNNVYAHVPDINDFTAGLKTALHEEGTITLEFPHLLNLVQINQFDTVYHEHYSYLALHVIEKIFNRWGLKVYDVEKLPTHGGSLRIYGCHHDDSKHISQRVNDLREEEQSAGMEDLAFYNKMQRRASQVKFDLLHFLLEQKQKGKKVAAYGAAAKANTIFNYSGIKEDLIPFICDAAKSKQGKYLPGSHIPVVSVSVLNDEKPDYIIIIPWNIKDEIMEQLEFTKQWGSQFVTLIPEVQLLNRSEFNTNNSITQLYIF